MRFRFRNWLLFLVIASSLRCGDGPTQPTPGPTPGPTPIPGTLDLNGEWTGTLNYGTNFPRGGSSCPSESIRVQLSHADSRISGGFDTSCAGPLYLYGTVDGASLTVDLRAYGGSEKVSGGLAGHASSAFITLTSPTRRVGGTTLSLSR